MTPQRYQSNNHFPPKITLIAAYSGVKGYTLALSMLLAVTMLTIVSAALVGTQVRQESSKSIQNEGTSKIVTDSAIARVITELAKPENSQLLGRTYDPINPTTKHHYLGKDGLVNTGDEINAYRNEPWDEWSNYDPSQESCGKIQGALKPNFALTGDIGDRGSYELLAYRYNPKNQTGNALIKGTYQELGKEEISTHVLVSIAVDPDTKDFPGIGLIDPHDATELGGREVKGNIYFHKQNKKSSVYLHGKSEPGDPNRSTYLNTLFSDQAFGAQQDTVFGTMMACNLEINNITGIKGTNFGEITQSTVFKGVGGATPTSYQIEKIALDGNDTFKVNTTGGAVHFYMSTKEDPIISLKGNAKIINYRTDGQPPQTGDVRFMIESESIVSIEDTACMQNIFLYSKKSDLSIQASGPGCPGNQNTNFEGVAWVKSILFSNHNSISQRNKTGVNIKGRDSTLLNEDKVATSTEHHQQNLKTGLSSLTQITTTPKSGIAIPDDVSSLSDLFNDIKWARPYRYGEIKRWQIVSID